MLYNLCYINIFEMKITKSSKNCLKAVKFHINYNNALILLIKNI